MKNIPFYIFLTLLFLIFASCEEEEVELDYTEAGEMSCTLNGEPWAAISFNNILTKYTSEPKGKRMDIRGKGMGIEITIAMSLYTEDLGNSLPLVTYKTNSPVYGSLVLITDGHSLFPEMLGGGGYGEVTLTAINPSTRTMSGTFEFETSSFGSSEEPYIAVDGIFTGLKFIVQ